MNNLVNPAVDRDDKVVSSKSLNNEIDALLKEFDNCIIDCEYLILPEQYNLYKNNKLCEIIYLGFNNVDIDILFNKFIHDYKNKNIKYNSEQLMKSLKYFKKSLS